jgi:hypothetical protein
MTYATHHGDFAFVGKASTKRDDVTTKAGVLQRIFDAILGSRQRQADREIASFIARRGGHITDDLEREIMRRLVTSNWSGRE